MAKRGTRTKRVQTPEERAEIDRDREAAHSSNQEQAEVPEAEIPVKLVAEAEAEKAAIEPEPTPEANPEQQAAEPGEEEDKKVNSVVAVKFKEKYIANARELGIPGKAAKRSNWDWLAENLAKLCLDDKHKISISKFTEILEMNGVDHSKWTNRNKGWEGRFRMTGRVALQKVVANSGVLHTPDEDLVPPPEFVNRFKTKE